MPQPVGAREGVPAGSLRADRFLKGYNEGNWMVVRVPPVRRGCRGDRALRCPFHVNLRTFCPSGGAGPGVAPHLRMGRARPTPQDLVIWLILPVVICLSQRLSHACLSISTLYCETANGSLNQLSFI
jgi:hypothetical protein